MRHLLFLTAVALCAACGARTGLSLDGSAGTQGGEPSGGANPGCSDSADLQLGSTVELVADAGVGRIQLAFAGSTWVVAITRNVDGRYEVFLHFFDTAGQPAGAPVHVTADFEPSIDTAHAAFDGSQWQVAWTADNAVFLRSVEPNGSLGPALPIGGGIGAYLVVLHPLDGAFDVELKGGAVDVPTAIRVSQDGEILAGPQPLHAEADGDGYPYGHAWLWPDRVVRNHGVPPGPFWLNVADFDFDSPPSAGDRVFEASGGLHLTGTADGAPTIVGVYDTDVGARLLELGAADAAPRYEVPASEGQRPRVTRDRDCGWAVLVDHGEYQPDNPLSTHASMHLLDASFERIAPVRPMFEPPAGSCLEAHELVAGPPGTFGVAWTLGCLDARRVAFATVTVQPL